MPLLKQGRIVDDPWTFVGDGAELPAGGPVIIGLGRWQAEREALVGREAPLGIRLASDQAPAVIADDIGHFDLVALDFPAFADGRPFSHARLLRERYGFAGELRAVGNVVRDQFLFLDRCGFDAVEVADEDAAAAWREALAEFSVFYQPAADGRVAALALRHHRAAAE